MASEPDYLAPYAKAAKDLGPTFQSLLWRSPEAQRTRFDVIADLCALHPPGLTGRVVADMGCGLADFAARLHERGIEYGRYIGVEGIPSLAQAARDRALPECRIVEADFAADHRLFDALVENHGVELFAFSGSLNTFHTAGAQAVLERAWAATAALRGGQLVFNFLSDRAPADQAAKPTGPANRFDTTAMIAWALDRTPLVAVRHDYWHGHDATIWMRRP